MLEPESDLGVRWLLELWELAPTPGKAARLREVTVAELLTRHRIRRFDAAHVLDVLRKQAVQVTGGTVEAASAHIKMLVARANAALPGTSPADIAVLIRAPQGFSWRE